MQIRRAEKGDIGGIAELLLQVHKVHSDIRPDVFVEGKRKYSDGELAEIIADENTPVFVAEEKGKIIGHCFCEKKEYETAPYLYIDDLCVDGEVRGGGIGRSLYNHVVEYATGLGISTVTLNVWVGNDSAMAFYEKMGFTPQKIVLEKKI